MNCDTHSPCSSNLHRCYIQLSDKLNNSRFFIESFLWTLRGKTPSWLYHKQHFAFSSNITNGSDSALAWVCIVIDRRRRHNGIRTSVRLRLVCLFFVFFPHFDVICDLLKNRYMATCRVDMTLVQTVPSRIGHNLTNTVFLVWKQVKSTPTTTGYTLPLTHVNLFALLFTTAVV